MMYIFIIVIISILFPISIASAEDFEVDNYPIYQDGQLIIPRVDTPGQAGSFQDAIFRFDEQINAWRLLSIRETIVTDADEPLINKVEAIITDSSPVQVFLKIDGTFFSGCAQPGKVSQQLKDNKFEVLIHADHSKTPPGTGCTTGFVPFNTIMPLSVYSLGAGTYEYSVNGGNDGTFILAEDNKL